MHPQEDAYQQLLKSHQELTQKYSQLQQEHEELYKKTVASTQNAETLLDASQDLVQRVGLDGSIQYVNETWIKVLGYSEEAIQSMNLMNLLAPEMVERCRQMMMQLQKGEAVHDYQTIYKDHKGDYVHLKGTIGPYKENGRVVGLYGFLKNISKEIETERELKAKEALFSSLIHSVSDLIFYKDLNGTYLGCNEAFLTFLGKKREELIGKNDKELYPPEEAEFFRKSDQQAILEKQPIRNKQWVNHPEKGLILLDTFKSAYFSDTGELIGLVAISRDITDLNTAQENLARHQKRYRSLFKYNLLGIGISGPESTFIEVNDAFCRMMGYSRDELVGQGMELITFPEDLERSDKQSQVLREGKNPFFHFKKRYRRKDGSILQGIVTASPLSNPNEPAEETVVIIWDITESEKAERARKESEEKFRALFDNIPMMIAFRDLETGVITDVNRYSELRSGMKREEIVGKNRQQVHRTADPPEEKDLMERLIREEIPSYTIQKHYRWGDEMDMIAELTRFMITWQGRKYAVSIMNDISPRLEAEKQLREQNEELKKINRELDQFVYSAAHDLRSPLTALMGLVNIIKKEEDPTLRQTYLELQEKSLSKLDHFIQDIVHHSKNARLEILRVPIDLKNLIEEVFEQYRYLPQAPDIEALISVNQEEPFLSDPSRLSVILNSLISNAYRYYDVNKERPLIEVKATVNEGKAHIVISDNGLGIKRNHLQSIFEMFYRANARTAGSGLGLYITKEAVHKLEGEITVSSEFGHGTTFHLTLPSLQA